MSPDTVHFAYKQAGYLYVSPPASIYTAADCQSVGVGASTLGLHRYFGVCQLSYLLSIQHLCDYKISGTTTK